MEKHLLEQKIANAKARILQFDDQIDGPSKVRIALTSINYGSKSAKTEIARSARRWLVSKRFEMAQFLLKNKQIVPTRSL